MSLITPPDDAATPELYWMAVAACIFGFAMSFGIGANDVGNCFATTVAAKSLTLMQVCSLLLCQSRFIVHCSFVHVLLFLFYLFVLVLVYHILFHSILFD